MIQFKKGWICKALIVTVGGVSWGGCGGVPLRKGGLGGLGWTVKEQTAFVVETAWGELGSGSFGIEHPNQWD